MAKYIALFVLFIAMTNALHLQGDKFSIRIRGKDGLYLTSCGFCPEINVGTNLEPHIVTLHVFVGEKEKRAGSQWQVQFMENNIYRIKNIDSGRYLAWCQKQCTFTQPITVISKDGSLPQTRFEFQTRSDNQIAIKASNGKFIALCYHCVSGGFLEYNDVDYIAFANKDNLNDQWAGFTFEGL